MARSPRRKDDAHPRELLVVRHAKSDRNAGVRKDFDRPLARRGKRDAPIMGGHLAGEDLLPDLVLSSPAVRAKATTLRMLGAMGLDEEAVRFEPRIYEAETRTLLRLLSEVPRSASRVMLVGHNPGLEDLLLHLGGDAVVIPDDGKLLPTGAVAHLAMPADWGRLPPGCADLLSLVRPKELRAGGDED
jgi:phosphohistidine phosphatase